ncbi:choline kinase family protein [Erysipelothrix anatis]|uniref:choline kinase family protein n=1 Tax=Erysipelothrix anatis TaxID=2683713 RepID=UPI0013594867|nr:choline kinase family protein [Erysipelothrix anatis]
MTKQEEITKILHTLNLGEPLRVSQLGGLTNRNFNVETKDKNLVIRLAGKDTDKIINRSHEGLIVRTIASLQIDAPLIHFDDATGLKISQYVPGALTMNATSLQESKNLEKAANLLAHLHQSAPSLPIEFDVMEMVQKYEASLSQLEGYYPEGYQAIREEVLTLYVHHENHDMKRVLSHNDPLPENFIVSETGDMFLVDWEYGGMNSRYWDLADVSIEADYNYSMDRQFIHAYLGKEPTDEDFLQLQLNKVYIDLLWSLWGYIRESLKEEHETEDFIAYGNLRFQRLKENLKKIHEK